MGAASDTILFKARGLTNEQRQPARELHESSTEPSHERHRRRGRSRPQQR